MVLGVTQKVSTVWRAASSSMGLATPQCSFDSHTAELGVGWSGRCRNFVGLRQASLN